MPIVSMSYSASISTLPNVDLLRIGNSSLAFLATTSEGLVSDGTWSCTTNGYFYFPNAPTPSSGCGSVDQIPVTTATSAQIPDSVKAATGTFAEDSWTAIFNPNVTCSRCNAPRGEYSHMFGFSISSVAYY